MDGAPVEAVQRGDVLHRHARRLQGQMLLVTLRLTLIGIGPGEELDVRGFAALAGHPHRCVLDLGLTSGPWEVAPAPRLELLVDLAHDRPAVRASGGPPSLDVQDDLDVGREQEALDQRDDPSAGTLVGHRGDVPSPVAPDLCNHLRALAHRDVSQWV